MSNVGSPSISLGSWSSMDFNLTGDMSHKSTFSLIILVSASYKLILYTDERCRVTDFLFSPSALEQRFSVIRRPSNIDEESSPFSHKKGIQDGLKTATSRRVAEEHFSVLEQHV